MRIILLLYCKNICKNNLVFVLYFTLYAQSLTIIGITSLSS